MTPKKVSSQVMPEASAPSTDESLAAPMTAPRKRVASAVKKSANQEPTAVLPSKRKAASKAQTPSDKPAQAVAAKTKSRSPARSSARSPAPTQTRKPSRVKSKTVSATPGEPLKVEPIFTDGGLIQGANASTHIKLSENTAAETPVPEAAPNPVLSVAELWEQGSPIRTRIAQLRTRNSLLEEQLQRLRPPVQVRGKKK
jgi:hypothetical protein